MPSQPCAEDIRVHRVRRHGIVIWLRLHEEVVEMGVLRKETQVDGTHVKISIDIQYRVIAHLYFLLARLHAELRGGGVEDGGGVFSEETHIHAYLCV